MQIEVTAVLAIALLVSCGTEGEPSEDMDSAETAVASVPTPARTIAITVDDLPGYPAPGTRCDSAAMHTLTHRITAQLSEAGIVATGFVNEAQICPGLRPLLPDLLAAWLDAGHELGNHTNTHRAFEDDPNGRPDPTPEQYLAEVTDGERVLRPLLARWGLVPRYFRHPYLRTGAPSPRKAAFEEDLAALGYEVAPVTIDNTEWAFAGAYGKALARGDTAAAREIAGAYLRHMREMRAFFEALSMEVVGREIPQVLLIHANALNADYLAELLRMYRERGYGFVSLNVALEDEAYERGDVYTGPRGRSWLQRWHYAEADSIREEPVVPAWVFE